MDLLIPHVRAKDKGWGTEAEGSLAAHCYKWHTVALCCAKVACQALRWPAKVACRTPCVWRLCPKPSSQIVPTFVHASR